MTPGEAALMKASATCLPPSAAFMLAMSASTAAPSRSAIGPLQPGAERRARPGSPKTRFCHAGKADQVLVHGALLAPPKPVSRSLT